MNPYPNPSPNPAGPTGYWRHLADPTAVADARQSVADAGARLDGLLDPARSFTAEVTAGAIDRTLEDLRRAVRRLELERTEAKRAELDRGGR